MFNKHKNAGFEIEQCACPKTGTLLVCLLASISIATPVMGAEIQSKSYPLAFRVERSYLIPTSLYIKCDVKEYNMSFPDFLSKENEPRESIFKELVVSIRNNDVGRCLNMTYRRFGMSEKESTKFNQKAERWIADWHKEITTKNLEKSKVLCQFYLGKGGLFIFGGNGENSLTESRFQWGCRFVPNLEGIFQWDIKNPDALQAVLEDTMRQTAVSPTKFVAIENKKLKYEILIPDTNDGDHVAYLQFDGEKYNFNVFSDTVDFVKPTDEVVNLFQKPYLLVAAGSPREAIADLYTDKSRDKYLQRLEKPVSPQYLEWYFKDMATVKKRVRFVVDAAPLYIVLYQRGNSNQLFCTFIIRDPKDGKLKLTNFNYINFVQQLFTPELRNSLSKRIIGTATNGS